jgi:hypothetical protein
MKKSVLLIAILALLAGIFTSWYYKQLNKDQEQQAITPSATPLSEVIDEPAIRYPVPESQIQTETKDAAQQTEQAESLPALDESDATMQDALTGLFDQEHLEELFNLDRIIRRFVVTIDNMPRDGLPRKHLPLKPLASGFLVTEENEEDAVFINPDNYQRYRPYVQLAETVDTKKIISAYVRFYPLFQQAYEDLGYPSLYFNDRLIDVIDHLLDTPEVDGPVRLVQPHVFYKFASPELEARSAGQKLLIRIGNDNASKIKAKLRELRLELIKHHDSDHGRNQGIRVPE